eukprot:3679870-Rhodomonas_salina.3
MGTPGSAARFSLEISTMVPLGTRVLAAPPFGVLKAPPSLLLPAPVLRKPCGKDSTTAKNCDHRSRGEKVTAARAPHHTLFTPVWGPGRGRNLGSVVGGPQCDLENGLVRSAKARRLRRRKCRRGAPVSGGTSNSMVASCKRLLCANPPVRVPETATPSLLPPKAKNAATRLLWRENGQRLFCLVSRLYCVVSSTRPKQEGAGRATLVLIPNDLQLFACPGGGTGGGIEAGTTKEETRERRGIQCTNSTTSNLIGQLYPASTFCPANPDANCGVSATDDRYAFEFTVDAWCDCTENMYHVGEDVYLLEEKSTTGETGRINLNGVGLMTEKKRPCTLSRIKTNDCFEIPYCKLLGKCAVPHDDQPYTTRVQVGFNSAVPRCSAGYHCNPEPMGSTQSVLETLSI